MVTSCKTCGTPVILQPTLKWVRETTLRERLEQLKEYECYTCAEQENNRQQDK